MRHFVFRALVVVTLFCSGTPTLVSAGQPDGSCPRSVAIQEFKKAVLAGGGTVDSVHVSGGIAVIVTASSKSNAAVIQKAASDYLERVKGLGLDKGTGPCAELSQAISSGKIAETMAPFGTGALFMITSADRTLEKLIQDNDCCRWCTPCGSNSTAMCCRRC